MNHRVYMLTQSNAPQEVRDWLANPQNRGRYLDDLVWLIHDRFDIVCSTTTMSKLKRKWVRAIECEETGQPLDDATRALLMETHPNLPLLHQQSSSTAAPAMMMSPMNPMTQPQQDLPTDMLSHHRQSQTQAPVQHPNDGLDPMIAGMEQPHHHRHHPNMDPSLSASLQQQHPDQSLKLDFDLHQQLQNNRHQNASQIDTQLQQLQSQHHHHHIQQMTDPQLQSHGPQIDDERLEQQLQREIASV